MKPFAVYLEVEMQKGEEVKTFLPLPFNHIVSKGLQLIMKNLSLPQARATCEIYAKNNCGRVF